MAKTWTLFQYKTFVVTLQLIYINCLVHNKVPSIKILSAGYGDANFWG